jgi:Flp pilus assembly protein TadD
MMRRPAGLRLEASGPGRRAGFLLPLVAALLLVACQTTGGDSAGAGGGARPGLSLQARLRLAEATDAQQGGSAATYAVLSEAAAAAPGDIALQERLASLAEQNERWDEAAAALRRVVARAPTQERLVRLGRIELRLGTPAAVDTWRRAVAAGGRSVEALTGLGLALDLANDHVAAQRSYRDALAIEPGNWTATANLGMSLMLSRQPAAAIEALARAEQDPSAPPRARHNLAIALAMAGQEARMLRLLRSESGRTPQQVEALAREVRDFARWLAAREPAAVAAAAPAAEPAALSPAAAPAAAAAPVSPAAAPPAAAPPAAAQRGPATAVPATPAAPAAPADPPPAAASPPAASPQAESLPPGPVVRMDPVVNPRDPQAAPALASPAAAAPASAPPVAGAGPLVQLGALESEASAQRHWAALAARVEGLGQHTPSIERFETGGRTVWRLRIRGLSTIAEANALCAQVRAAGGPCFATR